MKQETVQCRGGGWRTSIRPSGVEWPDGLVCPVCDRITGISLNMKRLRATLRRHKIPTTIHDGKYVKPPEGWYDY